MNDTLFVHLLDPFDLTNIEFMKAFTNLPFVYQSVRPFSSQTNDGMLGTDPQDWAPVYP